MSSTRSFRVHEAYGCTRVNGALEATPSPSKELVPVNGTDIPLTSPNRSDSKQAPRPSPVSVKEAHRDKKVSQSSWQALGGPAIPTVYALWCTCVNDVEDSHVVLPLAPCLDGDIFGVGKRPVQREIEADGCVRLVFVEE